MKEIRRGVGVHVIIFVDTEVRRIDVGQVGTAITLEGRGDDHLVEQPRGTIIGYRVKSTT